MRTFPFRQDQPSGAQHLCTKASVIWTHISRVTVCRTASKVNSQQERDDPPVLWEEPMTKRLFKALLTSAVLTFGAGGAAYAAECIAPANPGGGWDFTCRQIGKIMYDIGVVDKPVQVTNMAGAGGGLSRGCLASSAALSRGT